MYDVIIIGGGPTGSHAARRLAENGCKVIVLEKNAGVTGKACCTGIIGQECVDTFGIANKAIIRPANSATLFSPSENTIHLYRPETQAVILDRTILDISLAEKAQRAGAEYSFNSRAISVETGSDRVKVTFRGQGKEQTIPAKAIIIASGFTPGLNEKMGLGGYKDYTAGAQSVVDAPGLEEVEVYFGENAPGFFGWLVPTSQGIARAGLLARTDAGPRLKKWLAELARKGKVKSGDVQLHYGGIPLKPPNRTYGERMLAIGDAAGQVKPTTGGGIFYGLLGADIAADVMHKALEENDLSEKRLARYERAWRSKLGKEMRTGYWARKIFERLNERQIDRLFQIIKAGGIDEALLNAEDLSFDWHGRTIMKLLKYRLVTKSLKIIKLPFQSGKIDRQGK